MTGGRTPIPKPASKGFSLLELVLALVLLQVGILGTVGMIHLSQRNLQRAELTLRGAVEGGWLAGSLTGFQETGIRTEQWGELSWGPARAPVPSIRIVAWSPVLGDTLISFLSLPRFEGGESLAPGALAPLGSW